MKRLLWILLLFPCSTLWAADSCKEPIQLARMNPYIAGAGVAAACSTKFEEQATYNDFTYIGREAGKYYIGETYNYASTKTICKVKMRMGGNSTGKSVYVEIWTADGVNLNTKIGGTTTGVAGADWTAYPYVEFALDSPVTLLANTPYIITVSIHESDAASPVRATFNTGGGWASGGLAFYGSDKARSESYSGYDMSFEFYE